MLEVKTAGQPSSKGTGGIREAGWHACVGVCRYEREWHRTGSLGCALTIIERLAYKFPEQGLVLINLNVCYKVIFE